MARGDAWTHIAARIRVEDRGFTSPCWVWQKATTEKGYGRSKIPGFGQVRIHRATYEIHVGPIPDGLVIDHLCCVKACCNPGHLEAVTDEENRRRAGLIGRTRELCIRGHTLAGNQCSNGSCRTCALERAKSPEVRAKRAAYMRAWNARNREQQRERCRRYRVAHREERNERRRQMRAAGLWA